jgi:hypothetical protein
VVSNLGAKLAQNSRIGALRMDGKGIGCGRGKWQENWWQENGAGRVWQNHGGRIMEERSRKAGRAGMRLLTATKYPEGFQAGRRVTV